MSGYYLWWKLGHIVAAVIFLGNIFTGLYWKAMADRTGDVSLRAFVLESIDRSDRWFTVPGVAGLVVTGTVQALLGRHALLRVGWIWWSLVAFTVSGVIFVAIITPLQRRLVRCAADGRASGTMDEARYRELSRSWEWWGIAALVLPVIALALMVLRPRLSGLGG